MTNEHDSRARTIALLGGSFDPAHVVHLHVSLYVLQVAGVDEVWWVPCASHAFGKRSAPFDERLAMCELATREVDAIRVTDIESQLPTPSYTIDTLTALREAHPDVHFVWIVGSDLLGELVRWHRWSELIATLPFVVVQRGDVVGEPPLGGSYTRLPARFPDISSSAVRAAIANEQDVTGWVDAAVLDHIENERLYLS